MFVKLGGKSMTKAELDQLYHLHREIDELKNRMAREDTPELQAKYQELVDRRVTEQTRLFDYIAGIPDSLIRRVMYLRFMDGMGWEQVAQQMHYKSISTARLMTNRFLEKEMQKAGEDKA